MATFEVRYTPPVPDREVRVFDTLGEALAFAASVATPNSSSVDIRTDGRPTLSVIATNPAKTRRGK